MKAKLLLIGLLMLLVAGVTGCGGAHRYDGRLVAVDSLMKAYPDSALALVEALSPDSLHTDGDRAYRDLLLTQARYKCYITATSDSDINRALDYYRRHNSDREKLTRAYIYKGAVMEELNHPDSAMYYYKTAEATAEENDYYNRGQVNYRIGLLYQYHYAADSLVAERMRQAINCFTSCQDTNYLFQSMGRLGAFLYGQNNDSAKILLNEAISLARIIQSPEQYFYQSKLAGIYFYQEDYPQSKNLAMDIIKNCKGRCFEKMFYYYASRSFIKLGQLDSAQWVSSIIPAPKIAQDSFNYFLLQAELAKARNNMLGYAQCSANAERIHRRLLDDSSKEKLVSTELKYDASLQQEKLKETHKSRILLILAVVLIFLVVLITAAIRIINHKNRRHQQELNTARQEVRRMVDESEKQISELLKERAKDKTQLKQINKELSEVNKEKQQLEKQQDGINKRAAKIVNYRLAALNELYTGIKIEIAQDDEKNRPMTLMIALKELFEKKQIKKTPLSKSFWDNLRLSVEGEFPGIVTFVEQNYPHLSKRDMQLFLLLCAGLPNQIINICMNYTGEGTASKRKANLLKDKMGLDMKIDEFINSYVNGNLEPKKAPN